MMRHEIGIYDEIIDVYSSLKVGESRTYTLSDLKGKVGKMIFTRKE